MWAQWTSIQVDNILSGVLHIFESFFMHFNLAKP